MPPILSTSQCEFNGTRSCSHTRKTIPLAPIHLFTKQMVPSLCQESLTRSSLRSFSPVLSVRLIKGFLPSITFLSAHGFLNQARAWFLKITLCGCMCVCVYVSVCPKNGIVLFSPCSLVAEFLSVDRTGKHVSSLSKTSFLISGRKLLKEQHHSDVSSPLLGTNRYY